MEKKMMMTVSLVIVVCIATIAHAYAQRTPFMISGSFFDRNGNPCNAPRIHITNLNTGVAWDARNASTSNYYQLILTNGDVSAGTILQFNASGCSCAQTINHTVTQQEMEAGGIFDFDIDKVHNVSLSTDYEDAINGIKITTAQGTVVNATEKLTIGNNHVLYYKVKNGVHYDENVNITVKLANSTVSHTIATHTWNLSAGDERLGADLCNTTELGLDAGSYMIIVNASISDDVSPADNERTRDVTFKELPHIVYYSPSESLVNDSWGIGVDVSRTFSISTDQIVDVSWLINGTEMQTNTSVTDASYTATSTEIGLWNVSAVASNQNGTAMHTWLWSTSRNPLPTITHYDPYYNDTLSTSMVINAENGARQFSIVVDQLVNVSWQINGTEVQTNASITEASYTNRSAKTGIWNVSAIVYNQNGTAIQTWTWYVNISFPVHNVDTAQSFPTIHYAISHADTENGSTIIVDPGNYIENVHVTKSLTLRSTSGNPEDTTIQAADPDDHVVAVTADNVSISGFTVKGATAEQRAGLTLNGSDRCTISGNHVVGNWYGIHLHHSNNNTIYNNHFANTKNAGDDGGNIWNATKVNGTNICGGSWLGGNYWSDYAGMDLTADGLGDTLVPYTAGGAIATGGDYLPLTPVSSGTVHNLDSGENFTTIRDAICSHNTVNGTTIVVDPGIYTENLEVNKSVTIRATSGDPADTIVRAVNASLHVFAIRANNVNISGFTIENATAAAGIYLANVEGCAISNNNAMENDYGIYLDRAEHISLAGNTLTGNRYNIRIDGDTLSHFNQTVDTSNLVNNRPIYYLRDERDQRIPADAGFVGLVNCTNITVSTATLTKNYEGVLVLWSAGITLENLSVSENYRGIYLRNSSTCTLSNNIAKNNEYGVYLDRAEHISLAGNTLTGNRYNIRFDGDTLSHFNQTMDTSNLVNNRPIYYLHDERDQRIPADAGFVGLVNCTNITVEGLTLEKNGAGVVFAGTRNSRLENVKTRENDYGIYFWGSSNNTVTTNTVTANKDGICLHQSSTNTIYNNHFANTKNARDDGVNIWNITKVNGTNIIGGSWLGGNYWSDYEGMDLTEDGLGDLSIPYNAGGNITHGGDYLPLTSNVGVVHNLDTGKNFATIQAAIVDPDTDDGHTITVDPGNYNERVAVDSSLTIRSTSGDPADTIVDEGFSVTADAVNISGFTMNDYLELSGVEYCTITDNIVHSNGYGIFLEYSNNNLLRENTASNNPSHGIYLECSNNNLLRENTASNNHDGIHLADSSTNTLKKNVASDNNRDGIYIVTGSDNTQITDNTANNNQRYGICVWDSNSNTLTSNTVSTNDEGIYLLRSNNNSLANNTITHNNDRGIYLYGSDNNLTGNMISDNNRGIRLGGGSSPSANNRFYNNYFNNTQNIYFAPANNMWNITKTNGTNIYGGVYLGGNYWSDYTGNDTDGDGLGDTLLPYNASGDIQNGGDWHPLVEPHVSLNITSYAPPSPVRDMEGATRTFNITTNQEANVRWQIEGVSEVQTNESVTAALYTRVAELGTWIVGVNASNQNGTDNRTWIWYVTNESEPDPPPGGGSGRRGGYGNGTAGGIGEGSGIGEAGAGEGAGMQIPVNASDAASDELTKKMKGYPFGNVSSGGTGGGGTLPILLFLVAVVILVLFYFGYYREKRTHARHLGAYDKRKGGK